MKKIREAVDFSDGRKIAIEIAHLAKNAEGAIFIERTLVLLLKMRYNNYINGTQKR